MKNVASYIKNLGKSVAYSAIDQIKLQAPNTTAFVQTNSELFKEVYTEMRNYRTAFNRINETVKSNKIYEAAEYGYKNILDSIKTGEFYSKRREEEATIKAGGDLMKFDSADEFNPDFDDSDDGWGSLDIPDGDKYVASTIENATVESANMVATTMAKTGKYIVENQRMTTNVLYSQNLNLMTGLRSSITDLGTNFRESTEAYGKVLETHAQNSTKFYEESTKLAVERNAILKEMVEMQRNMYQAKQAEGSSKSRIGYGDVVDSAGIPDLKQYAANVNKNIKNVLASSGLSMFGDGNDSMNVLMGFADNPLKFIPETLIKALIPATVTLAARNFDESLAGFFGTAIAKLNGLSKGDNPILKKVGEIFGIRSNEKNSLDTGMYNKGAVPFDGIVRKSIVEVMPTQLGKIISLLSGKEEMTFDYDKGRWIKAATIKEDFDRMKKSRVSSSTSDVKSYTDKFVDSLSFDKKDKDSLMKEIENIFTYIYNNGGDFNPSDKKLYQKMSGVSEDGYLLFLKMWKNIPRHVRMAMAGKVLEGRASITKELEKIELNGDSIYNRNFNNSETDQFIKKDKYGNVVESTGLLGNNLIKTTDDKGNNLFFYMQNMYKELMLIRSFGTGVGGDTFTTPLASSVDIQNNTKITEEKKKRLADKEAEERYNKKEEERRKKHKDLYYMDGGYGEENRGRATVSFGSVADKLKIEEYRAVQKERGWLPNFIDDTMAGARKTRDLLKDEKSIDKTLGDVATDMQNKEKKSKGRFLDKMLEAGSLSEKFSVITSSLDDLTKKPAEMLTHVLEKADEHLYTFLYGADTDTRDEKGKPIKGFMDMMTFQIRRSFIKVNTWLDENILEPMKKKLGIESLGDVWKKGLALFHIDPEQVKEFFTGKDGILRSTMDAVKNTFKGAFDTVKGSLKDTFSPLIETIKGKLPEKKKEEKKDEENEEDYDIVRDINGKIISVNPKPINKIIDKSFGIKSQLDMKKNHISTQREYKNFGIDNANRNDLFARMDYFENGTLKEVTERFSKKFKVSKLKNKKDLAIIKAQIDKMPEGEEKEQYLSLYAKFQNEFTEYLRNKMLYNTRNLDAATNIFNFEDNSEKEFLDKFNATGGLNISSIKNKQELKAAKAEVDSLDGEKYKWRKTQLQKQLQEFLPVLDGYMASKASLNPRTAKSNKETEAVEKTAEQTAQFVPVATQTNTILSSIKDTISEILNHIKTSNIIKDAVGNIGAHAKGARYIKKSGLTAISEGEMIIPSEMNPFNPNAGKVDKKKEIKNERNIKTDFASSIAKEIYNSIRENAEGDQPIENSEEPKQENILSQGIKKLGSGAKYTTMRLINPKDDKAMQSAMADVMGNIKQYAPDAVAGGLLGGTVGLITGAVGGPLLAAAAGSAISIAKNSGKVQDWLFGEAIMDNDGNTVGRTGGVISKELQDTVNKYLPDVKKFGLSGAVLGLVTPFGPIGGLMMGSALAYAKNNDRLSKALFGDEDGLLNKNRREAIQKAYPNIAVGVLGSLFLGPFGLLGNAVLGSGIGLLSSTNEFKDFMFGEETEDGKREGGLVGSINLTVVEPLKDFAKTFKDRMIDFVEKDMIAPLKGAIQPIGEEIKHWLKSAFNMVPNMLNYVFEKSLGVPMETFIKEKLIDPASNFIKGAFNLATKPIKAVVSAPFKAIGAIGNMARDHQIKRGRASYMTAEERLQFRNDHPIRGAMAKIGFGARDRYREDDEMIANMSLDQVTRASDVMGQMKKGIGYFDSTKKQLIGQTAREVDKYFNDNKKNLPIIGKGQRTRILEAINKGELGKAQKLIQSLKGRDGKPLTPAQVEELTKTLSKSTAELNDINMRRDRSKSVRSSLKDQLADLGLNNVTDKNLDRYIKMFDKEKFAKKYNDDQTATEKDVADTIALGQKEQTEQIVGTLEETNKILAMILSKTDPDTGETSDDIGLTPEQIAKRDKERQTVKDINDKYKTKAEKERDKRFEQLSKFYKPEELEKAKDLLLDNDDAFDLIKDRAKTGNKFDDLSSILKLDRKKLNRVKELSEFTKIPEKNLAMILGLSESQFGNVLDVSKNSKYSFFDEAGISDQMKEFRKKKKLSPEEIAKLSEDEQNKLKMTDEEYENSLRGSFNDKRVMDIANIKDGRTNYTDISKNEPLSLRQKISEKITKTKNGISNKAHIVKTDKDYINEFSNLGLLDKYITVDDIKSMSSRQLDWILKDPKGAIKKIQEFRKSKTITPQAPTSNTVQNAAEAKTMSTVQADGDTKDYIRDKNGNMVEANTANNMKQKKEEQEEKDTNKGILGGLSSLSTNFTAWFKAKKEEDEEKKKEEKDPWWKKFLSAAGKVFLGATALGALPIIAGKIETSILPAIQSIWNEQMYPYYEANIAPKIQPIADKITEIIEHLKDIPNKIATFFTGTALPWFRGEGEFSNGGFPYLFENTIVPYYINGMDFLFGKIVPLMAEALVKNIPAIVSGVLAGLKQVLGWDMKKVFSNGQDTTKYNAKYTYDEDGNKVPIKDDHKVSPIALDGKQSLMESMIEASGRSFLTGGVAGGAVKNIGKKGIIAKTAKVIATPLKLIPGVGTAVNALGSATTMASKGISAFGDLGANVLYKKGAKKAATETAETVVEKAAKEVAEKGTKEVAEKGLSGALKKFMEKGIPALLNAKAVKNMVKDALKNAGKEASEKAVGKVIKNLSETLLGKLLKKALAGLGKAAAKQLAKIASSIATGGLAAAAFAAIDFTTGAMDAKSILGITEIPTFSERLMAGLIKAINGFFILGLIPESFVANIIIEHVGPALGLDMTELQEKRAEAEEEVAQYNAKMGTTYSVEEYNKKDSLGTKMKVGISNAVSKVSDGIKAVTNKVADSPMAKSIGSIFSYIVEANKVIKADTGEKETSLQVADDDPLKGVKEGIRLGLKIWHLPNHIMKTIGRAVIDYGKSTWDSLATLGPDMKKTATGMMKGAMEGDLSKALGLDFARSEGGNLLSNVISTLGVGITKSVVMVPALITKLVVDTVHGFKSLFDSVKTIGSNIGGVIGDMITGVKEGDYSKAIGADYMPEKTGNILTDGAVMAGLSITRLAFTFPGLIGATFSKIIHGIGTLVSNVSSGNEDDEIIKKAENGDISVFDAAYWKSNIKDDGSPITKIKQVGSFINKLFNAVIISVKSVFNGIGDKLDSVKNWFKDKADALGITGFSDDVKNTVSLAKQGVKSIGSGIANFMNKDEYFGGYGTRYGRGTQHLSQLDPRYNMRYNTPGDTVPQTMADSGCGPVAAATALNTVANRGVDPREMAKYSLDNGFKETNGGTKPQFFKSAFNKYGVGAKNMYSQDDIKENLQSGNPVVLMGRDSSGRGSTPYGKSPHYVVATGIDDRNNITIQNPESRFANDVYKASDILGKSTIGIAATPKYGTGSMFKYGKGSIGEEAANVIFSNEGGYGSVNKNDNGAVSVGKVQWHANRAKNLLKAIVNANPAQAKRLLTPSILSAITNSSDWTHRTVNTTEANGLSALLRSPEGVAAQDNQAIYDVTGYINDGKALGITDSKALIYFADLENQGGRGGATRVAKAAAVLAGSFSRITLSHIHQAALNDSVLGKYSTRRNKTYKACGGIGNISTSTGFVSNVSSSISGTISNASSSMYGFLDGLLNSVSSMTDSVINPIYGALEGVLGSANKQLMSSIFGETSSSNTEVAETENVEPEYGTGTGSAPRINIPKNNTYKLPSTNSANRPTVKTSSNNNYTPSYGMAAQIDYSKFITTIIEILLTIAGNTDKLSQIVELLSDNLGVDLKNNSKAENKQTTINRVKNQLQTMLGSKNGLGNTLMNKDTDYIINAMTAIARQ